MERRQALGVCILIKSTMLDLNGTENLLMRTLTFS